MAQLNSSGMGYLGPPIQNNGDNHEIDFDSSYDEDDDILSVDTDLLAFYSNNTTASDFNFTDNEEDEPGYLPTPENSITNFNINQAMLGSPNTSQGSLHLSDLAVSPNDSYNEGDTTREENSNVFNNSMFEDDSFVSVGGSRKKRGRKTKRKTRRQRVGSGPFTNAYRAAHRGYYGKSSKGEKADALESIQNNKDYIELNDVSELEVGQTYFEFVGDESNPLKNLGKFKKKDMDGPVNNMYGNNFNLIFDNGVLDGFNDGGQVFPPITRLTGRVFKSNVAGVVGEYTNELVANKISEFGYGGRKTKRKYNKSKRKTYSKRHSGGTPSNNKPRTFEVLHQLPQNQLNYMFFTYVKEGNVPATIEMLLSKTIDVNMVEQNGHTPLMIASKYGHDNIVQLLLQNGANPNIEVNLINVDFTAMDFAIGYLRQKNLSMDEIMESKLILTLTRAGAIRGSTFRNRRAVRHMTTPPGMDDKTGGKKITRTNNKKSKKHFKKTYKSKRKTHKKR
jgi:hypothetical protein